MAAHGSGRIQEQFGLCLVGVLIQRDRLWLLAKAVESAGCRVPRRLCHWPVGAWWQRSKCKMAIVVRGCRQLPVENADPDHRSPDRLSGNLVTYQAFDRALARCGRGTILRNPGCSRSRDALLRHHYSRREHSQQRRFHLDLSTCCSGTSSHTTVSPSRTVNASPACR